MSDRIKEILAKYGEPVEGNVWSVKGQKVILHKALERIAAGAGIWFDDPVVLRAEKDEAVLLVKGYMGPEGKASPYASLRVEWSIGEALVNVNYLVSGRQAAYVYAMAEKRAKDRVILKLIELHGYAYSEDEADDFRDGKPRLVESALGLGPITPASESTAPPHAAIHVNSEPGLGSISVNGEQVRMSAYAARKDGRWEPLISSLRACATMEALHQWADDNGADIGELPGGWVQELRSEYEDRVREIKTRG